MLDLSSIPLVDQHAHNLVRPEHLTPFAYSSAFSEGHDAEVVTGHARETLFSRRSIREIAALLDCEPDLDAVLAARERLGFDEVTGRCFAAGSFEALLLDDGFLPDRILPVEWHARFARSYRLLRVEWLAERLIAETTTWSEFQEAFRVEVEDLTAARGHPPRSGADLTPPPPLPHRGRGEVAHDLLEPPGARTAGAKLETPAVVGYKSIVAYRTGLEVVAPDAAAAEGCFRELRRQVEAGGRIRLACKPLNDWVVWATLEAAGRNELPVQLHTGFGDPSLDLRWASPLHLRALIEHPAFTRVAFVLLHAAYPFTREAGYLAAVYPNVYVDFGLAIPSLSVAGMSFVVRALLELTPLSKILCSTDAHVIPELFYLGAIWGRRVLAGELERAVRDGDLTAREAETAAERILRGNAIRLYRLAGQAD